MGQETEIGVVKVLRWDLNGFSITPNEYAQDLSLSHLAYRFIGYAASCMPDWKTTTKGIATTFGVGREKAQKALTEAVKHGYAYRHILRDARKRVVGVDYIVSTSKKDLRQHVVSQGWEPASYLETENPSLAPEPDLETGFPGPGFSAPIKKRKLGKKERGRRPDSGPTPENHTPPVSPGEAAAKGAGAPAAAASPRKSKRDLFEGEAAQPQKPRRDERVEKAYALIQQALAIHGRRYSREDPRDLLLLALIGERGMGYIEELAEAIRKANALPRLTGLKTHKLIEDANTRAKLIDSAYFDPPSATPAKANGSYDPSARISDDWAPSNEMMADIVERYDVTIWDASSKAAQFRAHYQSTGERRTDWGAGFMSWIERDFTRRGAPPKQQRGNQPLSGAELNRMAFGG